MEESSCLPVTQNISYYMRKAKKEREKNLCNSNNIITPINKAKSKKILPSKYDIIPIDTLVNTNIMLNPIDKIPINVNKHIQFIDTILWEEQKHFEGDIYFKMRLQNSIETFLLNLIKDKNLVISKISQKILPELHDKTEFYLLFLQGGFILATYK